MQLTAHYRQYELPWSPTAEVEQRFRRIVRNAFIVAVLFGLLVPFLPVTEQKSRAPELPDRVVKLVLEQQRKPPPPPPVVEKPKPEETKPIEQPVIKPQPQPQPDRQEEAKRKATQAARVFDALADLRENTAVEKAQQTRALSREVGEATRSERALLTSKVGKGSGGINNAALSRGYGGTAGTLGGHETTQVASNLGAPDGRSEVQRGSGSKRAARGREEIDLVFDSNKGAIYALYSRALRDSPDLKGKVVFEISIAPSGEVTACRIVSSELNEPELERKLVARVKLFRFTAADVEAITVTKPIEFFPAG